MEALRIAARPVRCYPHRLPLYKFRLPPRNVPDRRRTRSIAQLTELRAILYRWRCAADRPNHGHANDVDDVRRGVPLRHLGRFRALLTRRAAHILPVLTHAELRIPPRLQRRGSGTRQRQRALTTYLCTSRGFPVMPLGTRRVFRGVRRTRVTVGEISTACARRRWYGRSEDAPHGGVAVVRVERLEEQNIAGQCVVVLYRYVFFLVLQYIFT